MYEALLWLTGAVTLGAAAYGYLRFRDVFQPVILLGALLSWPYCFSPLLLDNAGVLQGYLPMWQMPDTQLKFLVGVASLLLGAVAVKRPKANAPRPQAFSPMLQQRMRLAGAVIGLLGVAAYIYIVREAGGFNAVYDVAHGRSQVGSGYVRDLASLMVPGLLIILYANSGKPLGVGDMLLVAGIAAPLLFHSLISASRGWTFIIGITLGVGWYMMRHRRPPLAVLLVTGPLFAFLIFFLAANRGDIHLGSSFSRLSTSAVEDFVEHKGTGQEYVFGSGVVIQATNTGNYEWGALYIIRWFVKPIPKEIWPTKYEDAARYFNIPVNLDALSYNTYRLGWAASGGAASGMVADMWLQFWWLMIIPLFLVGYLFAWTWSRAVSRGGMAVVVYVTLLAHSIYLTQQDLDAMANSTLYCFAIAWIVWQLLVQRGWTRLAWRSSRAWRHAPSPASYRAPPMKSFR